MSFLLQMDGDLQHPPESIPELPAELESSGSDIAVTSRYVQTGDATGLFVGTAGAALYLIGQAARALGGTASLVRR